MQVTVIYQSELKFVFKEEDDLFLKYIRPIRWDTNMRMRYANDFIDCHSRKISLGKCVDLKIGSKDPRNGSNGGAH